MTQYLRMFLSYVLCNLATQASWLQQKHYNSAHESRSGTVFKCGIVMLLHVNQLACACCQVACKPGCYITSLGQQDLVTQFLVKITFLYKLVAKKLDFVLSKLQISIWKDRASVAWSIEGFPIHYSVIAAMFFGSPEHLTFLRYKVLSPQRR